MKNLFFATSIISLFIGSLSPALAMIDPDRIEEKAPHVPSISPFKTQSEINDVVISTTKKVYEKINENWTYAEPGHPMQTHSTLWEAKWIDGISLVGGKNEKSHIPTLVLKTSPSKLMEALEDLITKPASVECTIALATVKIFCLKEILGQDSFNRYATAFHKHLKTTKGWTLEQFFHELPLQFLTSETGKATPGSITYIANIPLYTHFKLEGNGRGSNVFFIGQDQYVGFSDIYKTGPQSLDVIESQDLALFCEPGDVEKDHKQHGQISQRFTTDPNSFFLMHRKAQEKVNFYQFFNLKEINHHLRTDEIYI